MTSSTSVTFFRPCDQCDSNDYKLNSVGLCITNVCYKGIGRGGRAKCEAIIILLLSFRLLKSCGFLQHSIFVLALRSSLLRNLLQRCRSVFRTRRGSPDLWFISKLLLEIISRLWSNSLDCVLTFLKTQLKIAFHVYMKRVSLRAVIQQTL